MRVVAEIVGAKEVYCIDLDKDMESTRSKGITIFDLDAFEEIRYRWMTVI
ncbi:MAG: hypothetical protein NDP09_06880 [Crenarchaeota archaeon]|nr:hypothetical protein [Thermoproteota archaeon]